MFKRTKPASSSHKPTPAQTRNIIDNSTIQATIRQIYKHEFKNRQSTFDQEGNHHKLVDVLILQAKQPLQQQLQIFQQLRWGGLLIVVDTNRQAMESWEKMLSDTNAYRIENPTSALKTGNFTLKLTTSNQTDVYHLAARKTARQLVSNHPSSPTFHVHLMPNPNEPYGYMVRKQIPDVEDIFRRLVIKLPDRDHTRLEAVAKIICNDTLPLILTREAAILKLLHEKLTHTCRRCIPQLLAVGSDGRGLVTKLDMTWLRVQGPRLSHLEFARQATQLLHAIHHDAGIVHMDFQPDNVLITENGVSFVDFDSATRLSRPYHQRSRLNKTFNMVKRPDRLTSLISHFLENGQLGSRWSNFIQPDIADRSIDSFHLALLINMPHANRELKDLLYYYPDSFEAQALTTLTAAILRPKHPEKAGCKTASDLLRGINRIEQKLSRPAA